MTSTLVSDAAFDRQTKFIDEMHAAGKLAHRGESDRSTRRMGFSLVLLNKNGEGETTGLVKEEIFGPVLPIIPVSVSAAGRMRLISRISIPQSGTSTLDLTRSRFTSALRSRACSRQVSDDSKILTLTTFSHQPDHQWIGGMERLWLCDSVCVNIQRKEVDCMLIALARSLPFGGVGGSGCKQVHPPCVQADMSQGGAYHGYDGFREFSHYKCKPVRPCV